MTDAPNAINQLEHEHLLVEKILVDLRDAIQQVLREEQAPADLQDTFESFLAIAEEELYEHFDREEQVLFPYLLQHIPSAADGINALECGHDRMCGALSRMSWMLATPERAFGEDFDALVMLFTRFEANFDKHARDERALLQHLGQQLDDASLTTLAAMIAEI